LHRLDEVDLIVSNGGEYPDAFAMQLAPVDLVKLNDQQLRYPANHFQSQPVHAVAGIGNPDRFFDTLRHLGCEVRPHDFPDHHHFREEDVTFPDNLPIIMTAKDAVKCESFANDKMWYLEVIAIFTNSFWDKMQNLLKEKA
jgi:tetraacyldisaccharide 4'-kinase